MPDDAAATSPDFSALRAVCSKIVLPADPDYATARDAWNRDAVGKPAVVASPADAKEVSAALQWAVRTGIPICVAAGRHSIHASRDGAIMIDLSRLKEVTVDAASKTAVVGAGVKLGEFDNATAKHGLATTAGTNSDTGVSGLTLGGGFGYLVKKHGLTVDNLLECEVALLDGRIVTADAENEFSDLFWAVRGGGGNFGIVTKWKFRLHSRGPVINSAAVHFRTSLFGLLPGGRYVVQKWRDFAPATPDDVAAFLVLPVAGPVITASVWTGNGNLDEGRKYIKENAYFGLPVFRSTKEMPYAGTKDSIQEYLASSQPPGLYYNTAIVLSSLPDEAVDVLLDHTAAKPAPTAGGNCVVFALGGAAARVPAESTAVAHRAAPFWVLTNAKFGDPKDRAAVAAWAKDLNGKLAPWAAGTYNTLSDPEGGELAYGVGQTAERLGKIKTKYDPENLLRYNNNIKPAK
ncbi:FAD linked oxidase domain-containing protein [Hyaloraphidium curvatum]|nr:FAD linked oxidase domain-containing protein [Hyaloraphidium curvatum]